MGVARLKEYSFTLRTGQIYKIKSTSIKMAVRSFFQDIQEKRLPLEEIGLLVCLEDKDGLVYFPSIPILHALRLINKEEALESMKQAFPKADEAFLNTSMETTKWIWESIKK